MHCLSSSGRRDPDELATEEAKALIDEFERMQVFYVNIGGGEPTVRPDFWELLDYAVAHHVGVKFSTNGFRITPERAEKLAATDYVDVQISLDGATAEVNDAVRGQGTYDAALRAMANLQAAGMKDFKISVVCTRHNIGQLDEFKAIADRFGAQLRLTRLRPSGRGADVWDDLHPLPEQQRELYDWLIANGDKVLTGDSFFHLAAYGEPLPGLNLCGAGRVVCLVDPVGDVYACPFAIHDRFLAGNVRDLGGFDTVWKHAPLFEELRSPQTGGACTSARPTTRAGAAAWRPSSSPACRWTAPTRSASRATRGGAGEPDAARARARADHSHTGTVRNAPVPLTLGDDAGPADERVRREPGRRDVLTWARARPASPADASASAAAALADARRRPAARAGAGRVARAARAAPAAGARTRWSRARSTREVARRLDASRRPGAGRAAPRLRRERRARGLPGHDLDRPRGAVPAAGRARSLGLPVGRGLVFVNGHGGNVLTVVDAVTSCATRAAPSRGPAAGARRRRPRGQHRDLAAAPPGAVDGAVGPLEQGATDPDRRADAALRAVGVRAVSPNGCSATPTGELRRGGPPALRRDRRPAPARALRPGRRRRRPAGPASNAVSGESMASPLHACPGRSSPGRSFGRPRTKVCDGGSTLVGGSRGSVLYLVTPAAESARGRTGRASRRPGDAASLARLLLDRGFADPWWPDPAGDDAEVTDVTVVVPVQDRADALARLLAALPPVVPVVVVDDGSADPSPVARVAARVRRAARRARDATAVRPPPATPACGGS